MQKSIAVLPGDGIGEEVMGEALRVLDVIASKFGHDFEIRKAPIGGVAYEQFGNHFPEETRRICEESDAVLFGSVGGPVSELHLDKWKGCEVNALLGIRKAFGFNANFRPVKVFPELVDICPLRREVAGGGVDILFIRELVGGIYFGGHERFVRDGKRVASDLCEYDEEQIASVVHTAFRAARKRSKRLTSVDKANVLHTSKLWREVATELSEQYSDVELNHMLVDNCGMQIIKNPSQFDVIVTGNMFGDILTDAAAVLPGSLGLCASASMNSEGFGMFEPPGGSAQDIAGKGVANPIAQIRSVAMMLDYAFDLEEEARAIESSVERVLQSGLRTSDIFREESNGRCVGTREMADAILASI